jgi:hypothetical protein
MEVSHPRYRLRHIGLKILEHLPFRRNLRLQVYPHDNHCIHQIYLLPFLSLNPNLFEDPRLLLDFKTRDKVDLEILLQRHIRLDFNLDLLLVNLLMMVLGLVLLLGHLYRISQAISNHLALPPLSHRSDFMDLLILDFMYWGVLPNLQMQDISLLQLMASHRCRGLHLLNLLLDLSFLHLLPLGQRPLRVAQR